jgi:hypothetical protein
MSSNGGGAARDESGKVGKPPMLPRDGDDGCGGNNFTTFSGIPLEEMPGIPTTPGIIVPGMLGTMMPGKVLPGINPDIGVYNEQSFF